MKSAGNASEKNASENKTKNLRREKGKMKVHLFYTIKGKFQIRPEVEEIFDINPYNGKEWNDKSISDLLKIFREPYKYECRIDIKSGNDCKSYFIRRNSDDIKNGVFNVEFSPQWNVHNTAEKMTMKALKKRLSDELEIELDNEKAV